MLEMKSDAPTNALKHHTSKHKNNKLSFHFSLLDKMVATFDDHKMVPCYITDNKAGPRNEGKPLMNVTL